MVELQKSRQQIYRLTKLYKTFGESCFIHKNRGKTPNNKIVHTIIEEIERLYLNEYYDYNFKTFYEKLLENKNYKNKYNISYSSLYRVFLSDDIVSPVAHKETIKLYNERMNNAIVQNENITEEVTVQSKQIVFEKAHIRRSSNMYGFGQEVQMDASPKIWFGDVVSHLHLAVNKATKKYFLVGLNTKK